MDYRLLLALTLLLLVTNGAPVLAWRIFGRRLNAPVDSGWVLWDGQPLFGHSKTWRGLIAALLTAFTLGVWLGLDYITALLVGVAAMSGDLLSSFYKRRRKLVPSSQMMGMDQIPESAFPMLILRPVLDLSWVEFVLVVCAFIIAEIIFSRILFQLRLRKRPY